MIVSTSASPKMKMNRVNLSKKDYDVLMRYLSGLEGERKFLDVMCDLEGVLILWDIYLEDYSAQFDFLVIAGQYVFHYKVASRVVFMNESFQLIGDTDKYILFYYDLGRVVEYLKGSAGISDAMMRLSDTLIAHHGDDSKFYNIDDYDIEIVRTGVRCPKCRRVGMSRDGKGHKYRCRCGHTVSNREAVDIVYRMLQVFRVKSIRKCDLNRHLGMPDRTIKRILKQYYNKNGTGRGTYYTKDCVEEE